jgi:hypothetical protein
MSKIILKHEQPSHASIESVRPSCATLSCLIFCETPLQSLILTKNNKNYFLNQLAILTNENDRFDFITSLCIDVV